MTAWLDYATGLSCCLVSLAFLACVCTARWTASWALLYVARGVAAISGVLYAVTGHPGALIPFGLLYLAIWGAHWLFPPTGPRELHRRHRAPREPRPAPDYQAPGEWWRMLTVWAWHQNPVLAVLLWMAWGMVLGGLGLLAAATL